MPARKELAHGAADPAFTMSEDGHILAWNKHLEGLLGYRGNEVEGRHCGSVLKAVLADGQPLCTPDCDALDCVAQDLPHGYGACKVQRRDGQWVDVDLSTLAIPTGEEDAAKEALVFLRPIAEEAQMAQAVALRVFSLGRFELVAGRQGLEPTGWGRRHAATLLMRLVAARGEEVHKDALVEDLWPGREEKGGRGRLRVAVWLVRKRLRAAGVDGGVLETTGAGYRLALEDMWLDADAFERLAGDGHAAARRGDTKRALWLLRRARSLYRGPFLAAAPYADWAAGERERLEEAYLNASEETAALYEAAGHLGKAAQVLHDALGVSPCRESTCRRLMELLWRQGRADEALAQHEACAAALQRELGLSPTAATVDLANRIASGNAP